ncbi:MULTISPECIES: mechanosensitive ion channel family protein [Gelidibacter]|uniref:Mechanosensitive ion channel n=1 Tax=Gelidibacter pelagius TaxID=2819985 RepID=A0ABS3SN39_9FLAO|nr:MULTISPECIES: mechanosensitive ion channel domain-containing protein [Gelidibacter]MBO3097127.1 mechanosensitive ion channel [Gelidibacter pelagius]
MEVQHWIDKGYELIINFGPKVLGAILIWIIGSWVIKLLLKGVEKGMKKGNYEISLQKFLLNLISWTLKVVLIVVVLGTVGIETTSFAAILAAAGLALGLALQGSLANFAGGVLILIMKPFKIGDFIGAQGVEGTVKEISIFNTQLTTFGNQLAILPNGKLSNDNIINYSSEGIRRDAITYGIGYDSDIKLTRDIILKLVNEQPEVLQDEGKQPMMVVTELADSSVNLSLRFWAKNEDFWGLHWKFLEEGKIRLEAAGIEIPYPQRDVHLIKES